MFIGKTGDNADINIDEVVERSHSLNNLEIKFGDILWKKISIVPNT